MIAEGVLLTVMKATLGAGGAVSAVAILEGRWLIAAVALMPLSLCFLNLRHRSRRLRGKRAEGAP